MFKAQKMPCKERAAAARRGVSKCTRLAVERRGGQVALALGQIVDPHLFLDAVCGGPSRARSVPPGLSARLFLCGFEAPIVETMIADWRIEAQRYELRDIGSGNWAYMLKPEERGSEYPAWLCPTCFAQGLKGFLQFIAKLRGARIDLPLQSMQEPHDGAGRPALALMRGERALPSVL